MGVVSNYPQRGSGFNPKSPSATYFGAVGDGITDDTAALQALADYCAAQTGSSHIPVIAQLPVPSNFYLTTKPIVFSSAYTGLAGVGGQPYIRPTNFSGPAIVFADTQPGGEGPIPIVTSLFGAGNGNAWTSDGLLTGWDINNIRPKAQGLNGLNAFCFETYCQLTHSLVSLNIFASGGRKDTTTTSHTSAQVSVLGFGATENIYFSLDLGAGLVTLISSAVDIHTAPVWLACTYDGATMRIFVNGAIVGSQAATGNIVQGYYESASLGRSFDIWPTQTGTLNGAAGTYDTTRISQVARYTSAYTTATAKLSSDQYTLALFNWEEQIGQMTKVHYGVPAVYNDKFAYIPYRKFLLAGQTGGCSITDILINPNGDADGILCIGCVNFKAARLTISAGYVPIEMWNNCYQTSWTDLRLTVLNTALSPACFLTTATSGLYVIERVIAQNGRHGLFAGSASGGDINSFTYLPGSGSISAIELIEAAGAGNNNAVLNDFKNDFEIPSPAWVTNIRMCNMRGVVLIGGNLQNLGGTTPLITIGANDVAHNSLVLTGTYLDTAGASPGLIKTDGLVANMSLVQVNGATYTGTPTWLTAPAKVTTFQQYG